MMGPTIQLSVDDIEKVIYMCKAKKKMSQKKESAKQMQRELALLQQDLGRAKGQNEEIKLSLTRLKREKSRMSENLHNVKNLGDHNTCWVSVGKMFLKESKSVIVSTIEGDIEHVNKKISDLETRQQSVIENLKTVEKRFEDFVESHKVKDEKPKA
ncbi:exonuclease sbcC [Reticulomyxa filosa]|uniref:Exonuclease sbcC n=1 Tax=Reticulomyxa filosa TaxID=46433 RepID=X6NFE1_RETFI|nr:exonuclease sbcC [Reticulomyxa filosa]|eukprot:ETO24449.1 exonuclease sbcC [Reticulomyxa filosa]